MFVWKKTLLTVGMEIPGVETTDENFDRVLVKNTLFYLGP